MTCVFSFGIIISLYFLQKNNFSAKIYNKSVKYIEVCVLSNYSYKWTYNKNMYEPIRICITNNPMPLLMHSQKEIELMYFYKTGGGKYLCEGKNILFSSNELLVINPGEVHGCNDWGADCIAACIIIDTNKLSVAELKKFTYNNKISNSEIDDNFYKLKSLLDKNNLNDAERDCKVTSIVYNIMGVLSHYIRAENTQNSRRYEINQILDFIDENISEKLTINLLAKKMYLSDDHFYHIFKQHIGMSPINYILTKRIEKACWLLKNSELKISEIALECNFSTSSYFSKKFLEYMKLTPSEYKKQKNMFM